MSIEIKSDKEIYLTGLPVADGGGGTPSGGCPSVTIVLQSPTVTTEEQS